MLRDEDVRKALEKPAKYGADLDLSSYGFGEAEEFAEIDRDVSRRGIEVGVDLDKRRYLSTFLYVDYSTVYKSVQRQFKDDLELMTIEEALKRYDWVHGLLWKLRDPCEDKYTAFTALNARGGYFMRILEGRKILIPIQACFLLFTQGIIQPVHNLIVAEPRSEAHILTGCTIHPRVTRGLHLGVTEIYVRKGAKLTYTMVHRWGPEFDVRSRTGILVEDGGVFVSNYVMLGELRTFQSQPSARLVGSSSRTSMNNVVYLRGRSEMDLGGEVLLEGAGSRAEIILNSVAADNAKITTRGRILGLADNVKGHLSCRGLMLSDGAEISTIPILESRKMNSELSHEAAIGKIAEDQLNYLIARGLSRDEAESLIVRGFLDVGRMGLPRPIEEGVRRTIELALKGF